MGWSWVTEGLAEVREGHGRSDTKESDIKSQEIVRGLSVSRYARSFFLFSRANIFLVQFLVVCALPVRFMNPGMELEILASISCFLVRQ